MTANAVIQGKTERREKRVFPFDEAVEKEGDVVRERRIGLREIAEFNIKQAKEKRERELSEKERNQLEMRKQMEMENERSLQTQEYAQNMILRRKAMR